MKKNNKSNIIRITILLAAITLFLVIGNFMITSHKVIGTYSGLEHDIITIGNTKYQYCNPKYTSADKDKLLGIVVSETDRDADSMKVWSVKGDPHGRYIYTQWLYDGCFYKKYRE